MFCYWPHNSTLLYYRYVCLPGFEGNVYYVNSYKSIRINNVRINDYMLVGRYGWTMNDQRLGIHCSLINKCLEYEMIFSNLLLYMKLVFNTTNVMLYFLYIILVNL